MPRRLSILVTVITVALVAAACGRATEEQINQALGITPEPTLSAEQIAESTAAASATSAARLLAASSPGASGAAQGDVVAGKRQFNTWCTGCHSANGQGGSLLEPGSPGASVTAESLLPLIRDGDGHTPPGAYKNTEISDKQVADIAAYLQSSPGE